MLELVSLSSDTEKLRQLSFTRANVIGIMFCIDNRSSFDDVLNKWYPEIRKFNADAPIILIGARMELRDATKDDDGDHSSVIPKEEGEELAQKIQAYKYIEISNRLVKNLDVLSEEICRAYFNKPKPKTKKGLSKLFDHLKH